MNYSKDMPRRNYADVIRAAYVGRKLDAEDVELFCDAGLDELRMWRVEMVGTICWEMLDKATQPLFRGDRTKASKADVLERVGIFLAFSLLEELGQEAAEEQMEDLMESVRGGL